MKKIYNLLLAMLMITVMVSCKKDDNIEVEEKEIIIPPEPIFKYSESGKGEIYLSFDGFNNSDYININWGDSIITEGIIADLNNKTPFYGIHTYEENGSYRVEVKVKNIDGNTSQTSRTIEVKKIPNYFILKSVLFKNTYQSEIKGEWLVHFQNNRNSITSFNDSLTNKVLFHEVGIASKIQELESISLNIFDQETNKEVDIYNEINTNNWFNRREQDKNINGVYPTSIITDDLIISLEWKVLN